MGESVAIHDKRSAFSPSPSFSSRAQDQPRRVSLNNILDRKPWTRELLMLGLAAGVVIAIGAILSSVQDRELSAWKVPITTSALLSLLITMVYLTLTAVLSNCLNQLRWLHFSKPRPLSDFESYDRISRSAVSSILALTRLHKNVGILNSSAILVILIATLGPFVQQILSVHYQTFVVPGNASMPIAFNVSNAFNATGTSAPFASDAGLISSIYSVLANSRVDAYTVAPVCSTGNCTWTNFTTLSIDSKVEDVSDQIEHVDTPILANWFRSYFSSNLTSNAPANASSAKTQQIIRLPNTGKDVTGVTVDSLLSRATLQKDAKDNNARYSQRVKFMQIQSYNHYKHATARNGTARNSTVGNPTDQDTHSKPRDGDFLFFYIFYLSAEFNFTQTASGLQDVSVAYKRASAWKTRFAAVLQPMSSKTENGLTTENFTSTQAIMPTTNTCTAKRCDLNYEHNGELHRINTEVLDRLASITATTFNDSVAAQSLYKQDDPKPMAEKSIVANGPFERGAGVPIVYQIISNAVNDNVVDDDAPFDKFYLSLDDFMANLARSQTSWLRQRSRAFVPGKVWRTAAVYRVQWAWITVPVAIFFAIAGLVGYTAWRTRREGLPSWTDSTLAVAVHGIDDRTRAELVGLTNVDELERATQHINVRLCKDSYTLISDRDSYDKI